MNKFKKLKFLFFAFILANLLSCEVEQKSGESISNIKFNVSSVEYIEGSTYTITAEINPLTYSISNINDITIKSSDENILSVTVTSFKSGVITFSVTSKKAGTVALTLSIKGTDKTATISIKVNAKPITPTDIKLNSINLNPKVLYLAVNESKYITTDVSPKNAKDTTVTWSANNSGITVNNRGLVTGIKKGNYLVIATSNGDNTLKDTCKVYVIINVEKLSIDQKNILLKKGKSETLSVSILPVEASNLSVIWSSDNPAISISADGVVTGLDYGIANIKATAVFGNNISDVSVVTVAGLELTKKTLTIIKGNSETLDFKIFPDNLNNKTVTWSSVDPRIAAIDPTTGKISTLSKGITKIIVTSNYNRSLTDTCVLTVVKAVTSVLVNPQTLTLKVGNIETITASVFPSDASDLSVSWSSDAENIASVDATGKITTKMAGKVNIIATSNYGDKSLKDTCVLTIELAKNGISLSSNSLKIKRGEKAKITATVNIAGQTNNNVAWTSDAQSIATVNITTGEIYGVASGTANIIATSLADANIKDTCKVTVIVVITSISIDKSEFNLGKGKTQNLKVTVLPEDASDKTYTWTSDNNDVANVNTNDVVTTSTTTGSAILTATSNSDNTKSAKCTVNVFIDVSKITISNKTLKLFTGQSLNLTALIEPSNALNTDIKWSSSLKDIADVTDGGLVTAGNINGETKIYATSKLNPEIKDSCLVTVEIQATGINLNYNTLELEKDSTKQLTAEILPANTTDKTVKWTSSNNIIATVTKDGLVTAKAPGSVDIKATSNSNPNLFKICKITVVVLVKEVRLNKKIVILDNVDTITLFASVFPQDATDKALTWTPSNNKVSVKDGFITGLDAGDVEVIVSSKNGKKDTCKVTVNYLANITEFKFEALKNSGMQGDVSLTNYNTFGYAGDFQNIDKVKLIPSFKVSNGATVQVNNIDQTSGTSEQDFTSPVLYTVTNKSNTITNTYRVSINFLNDKLTIDNDGVLICKPENKLSITQAILADSMNGKKVIYIGEDAFGIGDDLFSNDKFPQLWNINLPNSILEIRKNAFRYCINIENFNLKIPNGVTLIGEAAFKNCSNIFGNLTIPNSVITIGPYAFEYCNNLDGELILPNTLKKIESYAFADCWNLSGNLVIPNTVTIIDTAAFFDCDGFTGNLLLPNNLETISQYAFSFCRGFTGNLVIPNSVTTLGEFAFYYCNNFNGTLTISNGITILENDVFNECVKLSGTLTIPPSVTTIKDRAFFNCIGFSGNLTIPNTVTSIGKEVFRACTGFNGSLTLSNSLTEIPYNAFNGCNKLIGNLVIPNSVTTIHENAFYGCYRLDGTLTLHNSIQNIYKSAFNGCERLTGTLTIPTSLTVIDTSVFAYCSKLSGKLIIPDNIIKINNGAFFLCKGFNDTLALPENLISIGEFAFKECSGITGSLIIPNSVESIGAKAFEICKGFKGILTLPNNIDSIGSKAFSGCNGFTGELIIPNSLTTIDSYVFNECSGFTGILTIPGSVTSIGYKAFYNCKGFSEIKYKSGTIIELDVFTGAVTPTTY